LHKDLLGSTEHYEKNREKNVYQQNVICTKKNVKTFSLDSLLLAPSAVALFLIYNLHLHLKMSTIMKVFQFWDSGDHSLENNSESRLSVNFEDNLLKDSASTPYKYSDTD
jgi:hypothetical protein